MSIVATCPCGAQFNAQSQLAGHFVPCPTCGQQFQVPTPTAPTVGSPQHVATSPTYQQPAPMMQPEAVHHGAQPMPQAMPTQSAYGNAIPPKPRKGGMPLLLIGVAVMCLVLFAGLGLGAFVVIRMLGPGGEVTADAVPPGPSMSDVASSSTANSTSSGPAARSDSRPTSTPTGPGSGDLGPLPTLDGPLETSGGGLRYQWPLSVMNCSFEIEANAGQEVMKYSGSTRYYPTEKKADSIRFDRGEAPRSGTGTAFIVHPDGILVTCEHVVKQAKKITARWNGRVLPARVIDVDVQRDLALLKVEETGLPYLRMADSTAAQLAQRVNVVGFPLSDMLGKNVKVNMGAISGVATDEGDGMMQVDATVNPGNSGGPMLDEQGHVLGVVSALLAGESLSEVGFAIPADAVTSMLERRRIPYGTADKAVAVTVTEAAKSVVFLEVEGGGGGFTADDAVVYSVSASFDRQGAISIGGEDSSEFGKDLVVDGCGQVHYYEGSLQLPYLLGSAGAVGVEGLPRDGSRKWSQSEAMLIPISEQPDPRSRSIFGRRLPSPYFSRFSRPRQVTLLPVMRTTSYERGTATGNIVPIRKKLRIEIASANASTGSLTLTGEGTSRFDTTVGMTREGTLNARMRVAMDEVQLNVPIKMTYKMEQGMTLAEWKQQVAKAGEQAKQRREAAATAKLQKDQRENLSGGLSMYDPEA